MKPSHCITPRSLAECHFRPSDDPIEAFRPSRRVSDLAVTVALIVGAIAAVAVAALS